MAIEPSTTLIISTINGDADRGGWQVNANFANDHDEAVYGRRVEFYALPEGGGVWEENYKQIINGSLLPQNLIYDRRQSQTAVIVSTSDVFLNNAGLQGIYFTEQSNPQNPHQITGLNLGKIVKHIVEQHTNISTQTAGGWVDTTGIDIVNSTSVDVYTVRQSNSIWQTIADIASNEFYVRYFTKQDRLIYEQHPQFKSAVLDVVVTFNDNNIVGQPELIYRSDVITDQVLLYALTDTGQILTAKYPENVGTDGRRQKYANLRCNSQARLDLLAQRAYKFLNRSYDFRLSIAGPWGVYLELYDRIQVTYTGTIKNGVSITWSQKKFWVKSINVQRIGNFAAVTELYLEEETL